MHNTLCARVCVYVSEQVCAPTHVGSLITTRSRRHNKNDPVAATVLLKWQKVLITSQNSGPVLLMCAKHGGERDVVFNHSKLLETCTAKFAYTRNSFITYIQFLMHCNWQTSTLGSHVRIGVWCHKGPAFTSSGLRQHYVLPGVCSASWPAALLGFAAYQTCGRSLCFSRTQSVAGGCKQMVNFGNYNLWSFFFTAKQA